MPDDPISDAFKFLKQEIRALLDERVRQRIRDTIPSCRDLTEADYVFALSAALLVVQKDMSYDHDDLSTPECLRTLRGLHRESKVNKRNRAREGRSAI